MSLKVIYFGTPQFAATVLEDLLHHDVNVIGVVTRLDKPQKRSSQPIPSPVKTLALSNNIPLLQPEKASDPQFIEQLRAFEADVFIVVAYGAILRQVVLDIPKYGCYNLHAGLLPAYRGAAPIQRCIMDGVAESGNTVIRMDAGMDTGDIAGMSYIPVGPDMTAGELAEALAAQGGEVLIKTLHQIANGTISHTPQDPSKASIAPKLSKEEGFVLWDRPADKVYAQIRGVTPTPGAWTLYSYQDKPDKRLVIRKASLVSNKGVHGHPGDIIISDNQELLIACAEGVICLREIQPEGKGAMDSKTFLNGHAGHKLKLSFHTTN
ncbi:Methionyl-tRNA formyltransferase,methionyl-tRNA formyltransferase,Folate-dependent phosphoribosylglycinamide formyltransferase PurN,methionyl-tRNA formyltransferase,Formyl transferase [Chlamydia poikilotherma]|uniref:Methionyl-tRNA formyltransferase n=1 Tax=Chlamydia poikilotherma TaxID=1967783 RepID=A0A3B0QF96_9CHLA|nr:methionyl-tRNA formyltransferase [Chlamydia poikilotherma]SYX08582.1 Methionyl-tRNA formyltransferase,methionyl-tRNA formyltransferase,Folate-dependent phosphoribosylglycinamide formyltransferase PurN,methionyl-tRNA formyltransferase,Formyl transferase [Chlamydia poikilotherma]